MNSMGTEDERGGARKEMSTKQVELEKRRNRALKALQIAVECGDDVTEALLALEMARSAYAAFLGGYRVPRERFSRLRSVAAVAAIAVMAIVTFEVGEKYAILGATAYNGPPFVWGSARFVHDVVEEGESLQVIASHKYLKACDWQVTRKWFNGDGAIIATASIHLPPIPVDPEFTTRRWIIEMPNGLKPGAYTFKAGLVGKCPGEDFKHDDIFEQNFQVVPKH